MSANAKIPGKPAARQLGETEADVTARKRVEDELRQREQLLAIIFEHAPIGIALTDLDARYITTNERFREILGYSEAELANLTGWDVTHDADRLRNAALRDELLAGKREEYTWEKRYVTKKGDTVWARNTVALTKDVDGKPRYAIALVEDITERREADEALRRSERVLREAQALGHTGSWEHDLVTGQVYHTEENNRLFFGNDRSKGARFEDYAEAVHPDDRDYVMQRHAQLLAEGGPSEIEYRVVWSNGDVRLICGVATVIRDESGKAIRTYGTNVDITERRRAEEEIRSTREELKHAEDNLRRVIDTIPAMAWSVGPDGVVDFLNQRWLDYSGLTLEQYVAEPMRPLHPEDIPRIMERWRVATSVGEAYDDEMRLRRADGEYRWFLVRTVPLRDEQGNIVKWYGTSTDIEDRKRAEDALRLSEDALRDSSARLQALSRRLVELQESDRKELARELHDRVGQTLTAMHINMDLIRAQLDKHDDPLIRARNDDSLQLIESTFKAVQNVMYDLRPPMLDEYGLVASLQWYAKLFTERTGIHVEIRGIEGWRSDPGVEIALFRITQEALNNVARHSRAKNVRIELRETAEGAVFTIEDDGVGFDRERGRLEKIGYGLITMRERAEAVSGTFETSSEKGRGMRITVQVPRTPYGRARYTDGHTAAGVDMGRAKPVRILLVDDHTLVRAGIRALVEGIEGARIVAEADNGREAIGLARTHTPDIVVMDISMTELNGIDATSQIIAAAPGSRVLILSMHTAEEFVRRAVKAGASGYLVKDSVPTELKLALVALMRGEMYFSSRISRQLLSSLKERGPDEHEFSLDALTSRQREVLQLIAEGKSTKEIAATLDVSVKTVETHRAALMSRLGIFDVAGLVMYAARNHLVTIDRTEG